MSNIKFDELVKFVSTLLNKVGLDDFSNDAVTTGLAETSLRGVDSHGIRLLPHYINSALSGRKNSRPNFTITSKYPVIAKLNADNGFGHAAGFKAIDHAMEVADKFGMCMVGVHNSSHPGSMGSYALRAARKGYLAFAFTHADSLLLSRNSTRPYFGTNPICFAAPRLGMEPYCLDMSTSAKSWNTVLLNRVEDKMLEEGIAADEIGDATNDPHKAKCLMPLGGEISGYKGYALSSMVEILCGLYNGVPFGPEIPVMYKASMKEGRNLGQLYMVFKADGCIDHESFLRDMSRMTQEVHSEPMKKNEKVILPGDKEIKIMEERLIKGIPIDAATLQSLYELSKKWDVPLNLIH